MARRIYLRMKSLEKARGIFLAHWDLAGMLSGETVLSVEAAGRVTAAPVFARFSTPTFHSAAMDGIVDTHFAIAMGKLGGLAILNLEGIQTRYEEPNEVYEKIGKASSDEVTAILQDIYKTDIKEELVSRRIEEMKAAGILPGVSAIPQRADRFGAIAQEAGAGVFVVQSTVTTPTP